MATDLLMVKIQLPTGAWVDVGYLGHSNNRIWFESLESYWKLPFRPVVGQVFEERGPGWSPSSRVALPNWFSHLLPEGRLRLAVAEAAATDAKQEFDLIRRLGLSDLPGAVRVVPVDSSGAVDVPQLAELEEGREEGDPLLKFSLAGAQLKFSVYGQSGRAITVPASGQAGNVILKFPDYRPGFDGVPEAELGCLELASAVGIDAANGWLADPRSVEGLEGWAEQASGLALAVDRFDRRPDDVRVHMEEIAQVLQVPTGSDTAKYRRANFETIAILVEALCGTAAVAEVIDRIVLNVLVGNGDAHLKNWAIVYPDGIRARLSPLYDVLPTLLYIPRDDLGLNLNGTRIFGQVTPRSFERIGRRTDYGAEAACARACSTANRVLDEWSIMADFLPRERFQFLTKRLGSLPLLQVRK